MERPHTAYLEQLLLNVGIVYPLYISSLLSFYEHQRAKWEYEVRSRYLENILAML